MNAPIQRGSESVANASVVRESAGPQGHTAGRVPRRRGGFPGRGAFRPTLAWAWGMLWVLLLAGWNDAQAQTRARGRPCDGQAAFVVIDRGTGQTVTRGWTTPDGTLGPGLILGPNRDFIFVFVKPGAGLIGEREVRTGPSGSTLTVPPTPMGTSIDRDSDGDGLTDEIEAVFGTNPRTPFSSGPGLSDFARVTTPPPPGTPVGSGFPSTTDNPAFGPPGIVASMELPGTCVDICAFGDRVAVACLDRGVGLVNIFGGGPPRLIAMVDTPGEARAVACSDEEVWVADGLRGLAILDVRDPATARIRAQLPLGGYAQAVAAANGMAYVGLRSGALVAVDVVAGTERHRLDLGPEAVHDVALAGGRVWVIRGQDLLALDWARGMLARKGQVRLANFGPDPLSGRKRLMVGGAFAFAAASAGFDVVDVTDPSDLRVVGPVLPTGPGSFKQILANGSGVGLAVFGVNPREDGSHHVALYDLSSPTNSGRLLTILPTPGTAYAGTLHRGLSYVADGNRGLQVVRYLQTDQLGIPPTLEWEAPSAGSPIEEGRLFRVAVGAADDVQVREVEFHLDGERRATVGRFPFETELTAPYRAAGRTRITLRARAIDTGGNATWSEPLSLELSPDRTPPEPVGSQPLAGAIVGDTKRILVWFSEALLASSVTSESVRLVPAGMDGVPATPDDPVLPPGAWVYLPERRAVEWQSSTSLPAGTWVVSVSPPLADQAGNQMALPRSWVFRTSARPDEDADGMPDDLEVGLGLDPRNPDSRGDGIRDGDRDGDRDGLADGWEVYWGLDPRNPSSQLPGVLDGDLDPDGDALAHRQEQRMGTHPGLADSDRDGWNDETEATAGSDPLDRLSKPRLVVSGGPWVGLALGSRTPAASGNAWGIQVAWPSVSLSLPSLTGEDLRAGPVVAVPPVGLGLASGLGEDGARGLVVARPVVGLGLGAPAQPGPGGASTTVAQPPVRIDWNP